MPVRSELKRGEDILLSLSNTCTADLGRIAEVMRTLRSRFIRWADKSLISATITWRGELKH